MWTPKRLPEEIEGTTYHLQTAPELHGGFRWNTHAITHIYVCATSDISVFSSDGSACGSDGSAELTDEHNRTSILYQLIFELPEVNRDTLSFLILHLHK